MRKKISLTIAGMFLLIFLIGCTPQGDTPAGGIGGNGLFLAWVPNNPPAQIYDDQPFEVSIEAQNNGAKTLSSSSGKIYFSGFSRERISGNFYDGTPLPNLDAQTKTMSGGKDIITVKGVIAFLDTKNEYRIPLTATACYEYETEAGGTVCIDPSPFTTSTRKKSCTSGSIQLGAQGAPIKIASVSSEAAPGKTRLTITVTNSGGGETFKKESLAKCSPYSSNRIEFTEQDIIELEEVKIGQTSILNTCTGLSNGKNVKLISGKAQIRCSHTTTETTEFTEQFNIKLRYGYKTTIQKQVAIVPSRD